MLGPEHPDTLHTVNNLAVGYNIQGQHSEADILNRQTLVAREKVLRSEHPDTLATLNNLVLVCQSQGQLEEAETLYAQALAGQQKKLGPSSRAPKDSADDR